MAKRDLNALIKQLEASGYKVKKAAPTVKKTFEVEEETVRLFMETVRKRGLKVKEAVNQAFLDWVKRAK